MQSFNHFKFSGFYIFVFFAALLWGQDSTRMGVLSLPDSSNWSIQINDSLMIRSGTETIHLPQGQYQILIAPLNQKRWPLNALYHEIEIQPADTLYINLNGHTFSRDLLQDQGKVPLSGIKEIPAITTYRTSSPLKKYIQPGTLVLAVVSNWTSFYLKRRADDYYDNYRQTTNLSKINHYYNQAANYDQYAVVMLGVSATALATYFYFLFTD